MLMVFVIATYLTSLKVALSSTLRDETSGSDSNESVAEWARSVKELSKQRLSNLNLERLLRENPSLCARNDKRG